MTCKQVGVELTDWEPAADDYVVDFNEHGDDNNEDFSRTRKPHVHEELLPESISLLFFYTSQSQM